MGRTRRTDRPPPMTTARIPYETIDRFHNLKNHKDEPLYKVLDRACTILEEYTDRKKETLEQNG